MSTIIGAGASLNILDTNSTTNYPNITKLNIGGSGVVITNPTPNTIALSITGGSFVPYTGATADVNLGVYGLTSTTLSLPNTLSSITGIVNKGGIRFLHDFKHPTGGTAVPVGKNIMLGEEAGNFTMGSTATGTFQASANVFIGYRTGLAATLAFNNVFVGNTAGTSTTTGNNNMFIGSLAGQFNTTGNANVYIGERAGQNGVTASNNAFIGSLSGNVNIGNNNSFFGYYSAIANTSGTNNSGFGFGSGGSNTTGSNNLFIGANSGVYLANGVTANQTSGTSIFIGVDTKALSAGNTNQIVIGYNAIGNGSNTVTIGNTSIANNYFNGCINAKGLVGGNMLNLVNSSNITALTVDNANARLSARAINLTTPTYTFLTASTYGLGQTGTQVSLIANSIAVLAASSTIITVANGVNFAFNTGTGTKLGTATTQKLAFWNKTPIVQPTTSVTAATFATVAGGTNIDTTDTFDGYTIGQVVKALRNTGLLA